jgi:hypothetical protein
MYRVFIQEESTKQFTKCRWMDVCRLRRLKKRRSVSLIVRRFLRLENNCEAKEAEKRWE